MDKQQAAAYEMHNNICYGQQQQQQQPSSLASQSQQMVFEQQIGESNNHESSLQSVTEAASPRQAYFNFDSGQEPSSLVKKMSAAQIGSSQKVRIGQLKIPTIISEVSEENQSQKSKTARLKRRAAGGNSIYDHSTAEVH